MASEETSVISNQYICHQCGKSFLLQYMYACYHGHYLCRDCYHGVIAEPIAKEDAQRESDGSHLMFPNPSMFAKPRCEKHNSVISLESIYKSSMFNMCPVSKKPIICPHVNCQRTIAVSSLTQHFHHEHADVAIIYTKIEARNGLDFDFKDILGRNQNICLVLIQLESQANILSAESHPGLFFILIVARMPAKLCDNGDKSHEIAANECAFFYLMSNLLTDHSYTIAVSTKDHSVRVKYFGPVATVYENMATMYAEGKGLILNHHQVYGMSNHFEQLVNLDLIIHERDDLNACEINTNH